MFDLCIINAQKGGFFTTQRAFKDLDKEQREDGTIATRIDLILSPDENCRIYTCGNDKVLQTLTKAYIQASRAFTTINSFSAHLSLDGKVVEKIIINRNEGKSIVEEEIVLDSILTPKILYIGDHLHGDVNSALIAGWNAAAILEEFQQSSSSESESSLWGSRVFHSSLSLSSTPISWVEKLASTATMSVNNVEELLIRERL